MPLTQVNATLANKILLLSNLSYALVNDISLIESILALSSGNRQEPIAVQAGSPLAQFLDAFVPTMSSPNRTSRAATRNLQPCQPCTKKHQGCVVVSGPGQPRLCLKCKERGLSLCPPKAKDEVRVLSLPQSSQETGISAPSSSESTGSFQLTFRLDDSSFTLNPL